jgi:hypothetical protein
MLLALVLMVPASFGATNVLSKNAVGYVKKTLEPGKFYLLSVPFNRLQGDTTITNIFPAETSGLPSGTTVFFWDVANQKYSASSEALESFPPPLQWKPGTNPISQGEGFWMQTPSSASNVDLFILGEVPDESNIVVQLAVGFNFVAYGYPVTLDLTNSALTGVVSGGDLVHYWDPNATPPWSAESYETFPTVVWNPGTAQFEIGDSVVIEKKGSGAAWDEEKPYTYPPDA